MERDEKSSDTRVRMEPFRVGPYQILRELGAGGMGEVFLAHDERLDRQVAIKRLRARGQRTAQEGEALRRRFRREAQLAARVSHPAIVQIHDVLWTDEHDCIVMEYVDGVTLRARLEGGGVDLGQVLAWSREIVEAMAAAHDAGVIHRDLKTENVLITPAGRAKITDFGVARRLDDEPITADSAVIGTFRAMSPEQATGQPFDHRTDLFSFGVLLYEAVAGESPFVAPAPLETLRRVVHEPHRPVRAVAPHVPAPLAALIDQLLAKNPLLRPRDFHHVAATLAELAGPDPATTAEAPVSSGGPAVTVATRSDEPAPPSSSAPPDPSALVEPRRSGLDARAGGARSAALVRRWARAGVVVLVAGVAAGVLAWQLRVAARPHMPAPTTEPASSLRAHYIAVLAPKQRGPGSARSVQRSVPSDAPGSAQYEGSGDAPDGVSAPADLALRAASLRVMLLRALADLQGLAALAPEEVDRVAELPSLRDVARALDADELVSSELDCTQVAACTVTLRRVRGSDAVLLWSQAFDVPSAELFGASSIVLAHVRRGYGEHRPRPGSAALDVSPRDYQRYVRLYEARKHGARGVAPASLLQELAAIRQSSPGFVDAYLLEADVLRTRYYQSRERADLERAQQLVEVARRMAPETVATATMAFRVALAGGELDGAARELEELERLGADQATRWQLGAFLVEQRGDLGHAVSLLRQAAALHPSWRILLDLAAVELRHGEGDDAGRHLEQLLARSPDHFDALSLLAQIELLAGNLPRAIELYAALTRRAPGFIEYSNLGVAELLAGRLGPAHDDLARAHAMQPRNPTAVYNLADAELLLDEHAAARARYQEVLALLDKVPDEDWSSRLARAQALAHLGEPARAVAELDGALRRAPPDNGDVAYAAAAVYAIVGDPASTLLHAGKAIDLGYGVHWFQFPWFAGLRRDPRFTELVGERSRAAAATPAPPTQATTRTTPTADGRAP